MKALVIVLLVLASSVRHWTQPFLSRGAGAVHTPYYHQLVLAGGRVVLVLMVVMVVLVVLGLALLGLWVGGVLYAL